METQQRQERIEKIYDIMNDFDRAMLVTRSRDGRLRARPMALADASKDEGLNFSRPLTLPRSTNSSATPMLA